MHKNSYNKVILIGHLGNDPEGKYTKTGRSTASFSLATNESWKQSDGSMKEHTEWHHVVVWDRLADFSTEYLYKGQLVSVEGAIRSRSWESPDGVHKKAYEIMCSNITPLEWKKT